MGSQQPRGNGTYSGKILKKPIISKLTEAQWQELFALLDSGLTQKEAGKRFGISQPSVCEMVKIHGRSPGRNKTTRLTALQCGEILDKLSTGNVTQKEIAAEYNVDPSAIHHLLKRAEAEAGRRVEKRKSRRTQLKDQPHRNLTQEEYRLKRLVEEFVLTGIKALSEMTGELTGAEIRLHLTALGIMPPKELRITQIAAAWARLIRGAVARKIILKTGGVKKLDALSITGTKRGAESHIVYVRSGVELRLPERLR